jgi:2',3'-cyclic-nucleotide 2'-phosphodiesterase
MHILFIGDIVSHVGRKVIQNYLSGLKNEFNIDLVIANGENVAGFRGLDPKSYEELIHYGIDIFTTGNHIWANKAIFPILKTEDNVIVPANIPALRNEDPVAKGFTVFNVNNTLVAVINLQGRVFMDPVDCPFRTVDKILNSLDLNIKVRIVDFHAEATSEKRALGHYLNGRVSAVLGTHTHIQTADEEILSQGTAYLTDAGMTGPRDSVLGIEKGIIIDRFLNGLPHKFEVASGDPIISFVVLDIDEGSGKARAISRFIRGLEI